MTLPTRIAVFGATSAIAFEAVKLFAKKGASLYLCARDEGELKRLSDDLVVRGAKKVEYSAFDALDENSILNAIESCLSKLPDLDGLLIAHGTLPAQKLCETNIEEMKKTIDINFTSAAIILTHISSHFEKQGHGVIAVISSPAGDRGRQSNYVYGSAKGALTVFLSGLRQRMQKSGVRVLTIKPGFVDTPMTADFKKGILFVGPEVIARGIYKAMEKENDEVFLPWFWRWIMLVIRMIPQSVYKKLTL
ncbi:MAG: SDR family oxidoreductase [Nitrospirae bacterium]|nr:SDR family oxidoreductase [Nitrospirota bacterium]